MVRRSICSRCPEAQQNVLLVNVYHGWGYETCNWACNKTLLSSGRAIVYRIRNGPIPSAVICCILSCLYECISIGKLYNSLNTHVMFSQSPQQRRLSWLLCLLIGLTGLSNASLGDRLPEFRTCVAVYPRKLPYDLKASNTNSNSALQHRLLFWTCPSECDYSCQHIITTQRLEREPAYLYPVVQFHGKWPFYRFGGMQEPASVLFSLGNFLAHVYGLSKLKEQIPSRYGLRKYYILFGYFGLASWTFSMIFHTRDFSVTEKLDYFGAGASVMYGLYYAPIRIFRLDKAEGTKSRASTLLRLWTFLCFAFYMAHISYLTFVRFDYTYNMAANIVVGIMSNILWTGFSIMRFRKIGRLWAAWPGLIVAWVILAMSLELFDFAPWWGMVDAHALWHLGTVGPTIWWYNFLLKDAREDMQTTRLKA
nr:protein per1 like [Quercus suber]